MNRHPKRDLSEPVLRLLVTLAFALASAAIWWPVSASAAVARVKEVASVQGVRSNPLQGLGLVIGLDGTGDQTTQAPFTAQSLQAMLQQLGVTVPAGTSRPERTGAQPSPRLSCLSAVSTDRAEATTSARSGCGSWA